MSDEEERALASYRGALGGQRKRRNLTAQLMAIGSVAGAIAVVGVGAMFFTGSDRTSQADPSGERDPFLCEKALDDRSEAEREAIDAGKAQPPPPGAPKVLYFCSPTKTEIVKRSGDRSERQTLLANAVYALEVDGKTRVLGLAARGMRYGWDGKVCEALIGPPVADGFLLEGALVDPRRC